MSVPELVNISDEPQHILDLYGPQVAKPGSYARNCLLARRLIERDVRFVQLFHMGWDQHNELPVNIAKQCSATDQPSAALRRWTAMPRALSTTRLPGHERIRQRCFARAARHGSRRGRALV